MATVKIPPVLRPAVSGMSEVTVEGGTVGEVLNGLAGQHPGSARPHAGWLLAELKGGER